MENVSDPGESLELTSRQTEASWLLLFDEDDLLHGAASGGISGANSRTEVVLRLGSSRTRCSSRNVTKNQIKLISDSLSQVVKSSMFCIGAALGGRSLTAAIPEPISSERGKQRKRSLLLCLLVRQELFPAGKTDWKHVLF